MAAASTLTWDITPPRRPSLDDIGGATLADDAAYPPHKATMPYADQLNQCQTQIERLAAMTEALTISVTFAAGVPSVSQFTSMRTTTVIGDFTVTDNGTGDTTITWPANAVTTSTGGPMPALNDTTVGGGITASLVALGVRVLTWTGAATPADRNFTVTVR